MFLILFSTKLKRNRIRSCRWTWCHLSGGGFFPASKSTIKLPSSVGLEQRHRRRLSQAKPERLSVLVGRVRPRVSFHFALFHAEPKLQTLPWKNASSAETGPAEDKQTTTKIKAFSLCVSWNFARLISQYCCWRGDVEEGLFFVVFFFIPGHGVIEKRRAVSVRSISRFTPSSSVTGRNSVWFLSLYFCQRTLSCAVNTRVPFPSWLFHSFATCFKLVSFFCPQILNMLLIPTWQNECTAHLS